MKRKAEESKEVANKAAKRHQQRQQLYFAALDYEKNYIERIDLSSARSPLVDHEWYLGKCLWPPRKMTSYQEMFQLVSRRYFPKNQYTSLAKLVAVYAQPWQFWISYHYKFTGRYARVPDSLDRPTQVTGCFLTRGDALIQEYLDKDKCESCELEAANDRLREEREMAKLNGSPVSDSEDSDEEPYCGELRCQCDVCGVVYVELPEKFIIFH